MIQRMAAALERRTALKARTDALRLINSTGDGLDGLILETYGRHVSVQIFTPAWRERIGLLKQFIADTLKPLYAIVKDRTASSGAAADAFKAQVLIDQGGPRTVVHEWGLRFSVDVHDGLNAGLFLDMRPHRHAVGQAAKAKRVLNCFAYTCAFGVHARRCGAADVVNVDVSKNVLERGRANYELNGIAASPHEFTRADAVQYIERAVKKGNIFDIIIIDPPSFARAAAGVFQVKKDLPRLIRCAIQVLAPGGILLAASNHSSIAHKDIARMMTGGLNGRKITAQQRIGQDIDFPGTNTFKESHLAGVWAVIK